MRERKGQDMNAPWKVGPQPKAKCSIDWCDRPVKAHGYCAGHHQRLLKGVDLNKPWRQSSHRQCTASPTCQRTGRKGSRGMCDRHYAADQKRRRAEGDWSGFVSTDETNAHIDVLLESGMSLQRIADVAGLSRVGLRKMRNAKSMWATNSEKILAIEPDTFYAGETGFVPLLGPLRRLRALVALGYTNVELAERTGMSVGTMDNIMNERIGKVCMEIAVAIDEAFRDLQLVPPPSNRANTAARNRAAKLGWALPLAWDEESIDNPAAEPFVAEVIRGHKSRADDFVARIDDHRSVGHTDDHIAAGMGLTVTQLQEKLRRYGLKAGRRYRDIEEYNAMRFDNSMSKKSLGVAA